MVSILVVAAPTLWLVNAVVAFSLGRREGRVIWMLVQGSALLALGGALAAAALAALTGAPDEVAIGPAEIHWRLRYDVVTKLMIILVAFVGWIVVRYAETYLEGEQRRGPFIGWLALILSSVLTLIMAGDLIPFVLAWIATSLFLHRLLLFYPERVAAQRAARKKFAMARLSDVAMIGAALALVSAFGSTDITTILNAARAGAGGDACVCAAGLLAVAAIFKSAQFPTHGWLIEVMEAPTPVSALLHAGIINAGGFLLIRFAYVLAHAPGVLAMLVVIGGFTALFGSLVMLTQPAVKTSLAWSTVAQMGFMMFECGLGLFALALLHILAHSLYKAHAFLSSGGAVEKIAALRRPGPIAIPKAGAVARAFAAAILLYILIGVGFGLGHKSPQAIALGAILVFGVAYMLAQGFADQAPRALTRRTAIYAVSTTLSYFALQSVAQTLTAHNLPLPPSPGPLQWWLIILAVLSFGVVAVVQAMFPLWADHPAAAGLRVHLSNGFYVNALFDRMTGGWSARRAAG